MAGASRNYKQVPDAMRVAKPGIECIEDNAMRIAAASLLHVHYACSWFLSSFQGASSTARSVSPSPTGISLLCGALSSASSVDDVNHNHDEGDYQKNVDKTAQGIGRNKPE
jgi:hypothetical protein